LHLYVHIPFCLRICPYCAFYKHMLGRSDLEGFVRAVAQEAKLRLPQGYAPQTIYFGGGTPSLLSPKHLDILVEGLKETVDFSRVIEWSFESNPATFTAAKAEQWARLGITRVSLGAQSFEPELLKTLGRTHTPQQIEQSVAMLRAAGIPQVNIDLMFSLPGQMLNQWRHTLECAVSQSPDHISTYNLTYEEDTAFFEAFGADANDEDTDVAMFTMADEILTGAGYRHYEISNFARDGKISHHNLACWRGEDYYGLGPGAYGTICGTRYRNTEDTAAYTAALKEGRMPEFTQETISPADRRTELLGLRLRTDEGLPPELLREQDAGLVDMLQQEGLATLTADGRLLLTLQGRLLADEIAVQLLA
jgi:oxygen-independent coproporphyrinogen-3 oxidase